MSVWQSWIQSNPIPIESIYYWMYEAGLHACPEQEIQSMLWQAGKQIRKKDWENYERGLSKSYFRDNTIIGDRISIPINPVSERKFTSFKLTDFPTCNTLVDYQRRWVPCNASNKPMIKWSERMMTFNEAASHGIYLAESMYLTPWITLDIDGDHNDIIHPELIQTFYPFIKRTHALVKQSFYNGMPTSFHLTFRTNRLINTKHFTECCIDLLGNARNQLRYRKRKVWNGLFPMELNEEIWDFLMAYIERKSYASSTYSYQYR